MDCPVDIQGGFTSTERLNEHYNTYNVDKRKMLVCIPLLRNVCWVIEQKKDAANNYLNCPGLSGKSKHIFVLERYSKNEASMIASFSRYMLYGTFDCDTEGL